MGTCERTAGTLDHSTRRANTLDIADPVAAARETAQHGAPTSRSRGAPLTITIHFNAALARLFRPDASQSCPNVCESVRRMRVE
jgi:hypothetical protein